MEIRRNHIGDKQFSHFIYCDFGEDGRKTLISQHSSLEIAQREWNRVHKNYTNLSDKKTNIWIEEGRGFPSKKCFGRAKIQEIYETKKDIVPSFIQADFKDVCLKASYNESQNDAFDAIWDNLLLKTEELKSFIDTFTK